MSIFRIGRFFLVLEQIRYSELEHLPASASPTTVTLQGRLCVYDRRACILCHTCCRRILRCTACARAGPQVERNKKNDSEHAHAFSSQKSSSLLPKIPAVEAWGEQSTAPKCAGDGTDQERCPGTPAKSPSASPPNRASGPGPKLSRA